MPESGEISQENKDAVVNGDAASDAGGGEPATAARKNISEKELDDLIAQASNQPSGKPEDSQSGVSDADAAPYDFEKVLPAEFSGKDRNIKMLMDVNLNLRVELGRRKMNIEDILRLGRGSVVELDKLAGDSLDILVNNRLVARGEVLVLNDNFCIRVTSIVSPGGDAPQPRQRLEASGK